MRSRGRVRRPHWRAQAESGAARIGMSAREIGAEMRAGADRAQGARRRSGGRWRRRCLRGRRCRQDPRAAGAAQVASKLVRRWRWRDSWAWLFCRRRSAACAAAMPRTRPRDDRRQRRPPAPVAGQRSHGAAVHRPAPRRWKFAEEGHAGLSAANGRQLGMTWHPRRGRPPAPGSCRGDGAAALSNRRYEAARSRGRARRSGAAAPGCWPRGKAASGGSARWA